MAPQRLLALLNPYKKLRRGQALLAEKVCEAFLESKVLAAQWPPGVGKTLAVLLGALEAGAPKVIYLARTRSQFQAPLRESLALLSSGVSMPTVALVNKMDLCLLRKDPSIGYSEFLKLCKAKRAAGLCPFNRSATLSDGFSILDETSLRELGLRKRACPFQIAWSLLSRARLIVASYPYLFDTELLKYFIDHSGVDLGEVLLVVDEAHNLPKQISEVSRRVLGEQSLIQARRELAKIGFRGISDITGAARVIDGLLALLRRYSRVQAEARIEGSELEGVGVFSREFIALATLYERETGTSSSLWRVAEFLSSVEKMGPEHLLYVTSREGERQFHLVLVNPARVARRVFERVRSSVLMSATLPPREYLVATLGLDKERLETVVYPYLWGSRVQVIVAKGISSRYSSRDENTFKLYGYLIDKMYARAVAERGRARALVVFPSYSFLVNVHPYIRSQPKIRERPDTRLEELLEKVEGLHSFLLLVVAWGKFSEGIELRSLGKSSVDIVIVAGLPMPEPSLENIAFMERLREHLSDEERAWEHTFLYPALFRVMQAIGRGLRTEEDTVQAYILDERILERGRDYLESAGLSLAVVEVADLLA
uniref:ATP-dependent DNA helicase n=1 Tax=Thermofilum pendens TaxID=2269 RepID=A0A7C4BA94_THEPE